MQDGLVLTNTWRQHDNHSLLARIIVVKNHEYLQWGLIGIHLYRTTNENSAGDSFGLEISNNATKNGEKW